MRPCTDGDLGAIAELFNACETVDQTGIWETVERLEQALNTPSFNRAENLRLWENSEGELVGYGSVWIDPSQDGIDGFLNFRVHPSVRNQGLEEEIISWGENRLKEATKDCNGTVKLYSGARSDRGDVITILQNLGFIAVRYFFRMKRSLAKPIDEPKFPEGFKLRIVEPEKDAMQWVEMFNQTFIDHWNHHDYTVEEFLHDCQHSEYNSDLNLIAIAPDGTFAAFCESRIHAEDNKRNGRNEGWIGVLGTRRGFRQLGLGRAMLLTAMQHLKTKGMDSAILGVDAENPSGALRLYESVGFEKVLTNISYVKNL
ncbi:GNAT family N-acetyltransferase [Capilliphycus salinus ALCB114379]|uniref:GNAT family N-acetyltransferase n=1 Tax=Capilliphycus salinus TaxID=2768948 RepID=UPI0039A66026